MTVMSVDLLAVYSVKLNVRWFTHYCFQQRIQNNGEWYSNACRLYDISHSTEWYGQMHRPPSIATI